jgi:hypothetical protein
MILNTKKPLSQKGRGLYRGTTLINVYKYVYIHFIEDNGLGRCTFTLYVVPVPTQEVNFTCPFHKDAFSLRHLLPKRSGTGYFSPSTFLVSCSFVDYYIIKCATVQMCSYPFLK